MALRTMMRTVLPLPVYSFLSTQWRRATGRPAVGEISFGDLRRIQPISRFFGFDRGQPIDRYYVESFLERHAGDIRGRVLEIGDNAYTIRFGGRQVARSDILHVSADSPEATIVGDLAEPGVLPADSFDCVVLTQTLHLIYDMRKAVENVQHSLKPGGVCLATVPGVTQVDCGEWSGIWWWSLTSHAARRLFEEAFPAGAEVTVSQCGNILTATGFLHGIAAAELAPEELDHVDPQFPVAIMIRAVKPGGASG